ncbi:MAG: LysM peptidoglycan-binding domain-containing protein [Pseudanabaenaceae cyanobacterium]
MSVVPKTAVIPDSSLLSGGDQLPQAMRRLLAVLGFSVSVGSAGIMLLYANAERTTIAEIQPAPETLPTVLSQNTDRKYELARTAIATGEVDQPTVVAVVPEPVANPAPTVIIHEVQQDETLWQLTQMYRVDAASIAASNNISAATELQVGMQLVIPPVDGLVHRVKPGETLDSIASFYKVAKADILKYSGVAAPDFLAIDQPLVIPGNVKQLLAVKETHAKQKLIAEKERLRRRLAQIEGKTTLVANTLEPKETPRISKPPKPDSTFTYTVRPGDTVETIARRHGVSQQEIVALNKLENPHWLQVNQELRLPLQPPPVVVATAPGRVGMAEPIAPPGPWQGLYALTGSNRPMALNLPIPSTPIDSLTEQLPAPVIPSPRIVPAPEPKAPPTTLSEQDARPPVAVKPELASEPTVVAVAVPLSQLAEQVETTLTRPSASALLAPESEARMTSQELRRLEQEVDQLTVKLREAEQRRRLAAPTPTGILPPAPRPQLPNLSAKAYLPEVQDYGLSMSGFIWPTQGVLTSGFGPRWGRIHQGIDIAGPVGTPIVAAASGKVVFSGWNDGGYGYMIDILHPDGTITRYAHNSALYVRTGEQVTQGQLIAAMGSTGYSTGPHLHFEIRPNGGAAVDPMIFLGKVPR